MPSITRIEVTDKDGWKKDYPLQRSICLIGSAPGSDVALDRRHGSGVEPRHLQIIHLPNQGYRLVNLSDNPILLDETGQQRLDSRAAMEIHAGQRIKVGDFTLAFHAKGSGSAPVAAAGGTASLLPADTGAVSLHPSDYIGLELLLPQTTLSPEQPVDGFITIRNQGDKPGVQFKLEVEGLSEACYNIGPGPILFPNAEKTLPLRLHHPQQTTPAAGTVQLKIHAVAPEAYPRERATVTALIKILPFYRHTLSVERIK